MGKKPGVGAVGVGMGERDRDNLVLPSFLPSHLLASGSGCKQGNLGDVVYRVQRVPGKCSLQDLLAEQVGEKCHRSHRLSVVVTTSLTLFREDSYGLDKMAGMFECFGPLLGGALRKTDNYIVELVGWGWT